MLLGCLVLTCSNSGFWKTRRSRRSEAATIEVQEAPLFEWQQAYWLHVDLTTIYSSMDDAGGTVIDRVGCHWIDKGELYIQLIGYGRDVHSGIESSNERKASSS